MIGSPRYPGQGPIPGCGDLPFGNDPLRYAIISDIHGNIQALEAVMDSVKSQGADSVLCLGDVVGYGARPAECVEMVRETCRVVLLGNHDAAAVGKTPVDYFNPLARSAIEWTRKALHDEISGYLRDRPLLFDDEFCAATHATFSDPEAWDYILSPYEAAPEFESSESRILFYGHTHFPAIFVSDGRRVEGIRARDIALEDRKRYLINVGSVGQPRDGNPASCYLIFDAVQGKITYHRIPYDIESSQRDILATKIPAELAVRLSYGR